MAFLVIDRVNVNTTAFATYLAVLTFEGAYKYLFSNIGLLPLMYIPKLFLVLCILLSISRKIKNAKYLFFYLIILPFSVLSGVYWVGDLRQVAYGVYIWIPFFFAFTCDVDFSNRSLRKLIIFCFFMTVLGVAYDFNHDMPWTGFSYEVGGAEAEGSRDWAQFGISRPSGFASISTAAASIMFFCFSYLLAYLSSKGLKIFLWLLCGFGIVISTTKGIFAAFLILSIVIFFTKVKMIRMKKFVLFFSFLISLYFPFSLLFSNYKYREFNNILDLLFLTFFIRIFDAWPRVLDEISKSGNAITGKGFGAFGSSSYRYGSIYSNAVDNFYLYLYGTLGVLGLVFFIIIFLRYFYSYRPSKSESLFLEYLLCGIFVYGMFVNLIEFSIFGFICGYSLKILLSTNGHKRFQLNKG